ncbi:hypothetical protein, partial [Ralstonia pickettii]|uniref:hypothetical protein n=1 Tax=Ralstonia pickettii TaxID=329 RepID=UPI001C71BC0E
IAWDALSAKALRGNRKKMHEKDDYPLVDGQRAEFRFWNLRRLCRLSHSPVVIRMHFKRDRDPLHVVACPFGISRLVRHIRKPRFRA